MFGRLLDWYSIYIHFRGLLPPNGSLPGAKFTLRPSLAFFCFGSVTARHWSSGRQPNCGMVQGMDLWNFRSSSFSTEGATYIPRAAITLGIGPHSSLRFHDRGIFRKTDPISWKAHLGIIPCNRDFPWNLAHFVSFDNLYFTDER